MAKFEFFMPMIPPTITDQQHRIGRAPKGKRVPVYDPPELAQAKALLKTHLAVALKMLTHPQEPQGQSPRSPQPQQASQPQQDGVNEHANNAGGAGKAGAVGAGDAWAADATHGREADAHSRPYVKIEHDPIRLETVWCFPASATHPSGTWKTSKPDTDNLQKALKDCMTKVGFWKDDALVVHDTVSKIYNDVPGIWIGITPITQQGFISPAVGL